MTAAQVLYNGTLAGILSKSGGKYHFVYDNEYLSLPQSKPVSLTLPLCKKEYESDILFPAFVNMLSEGANKAFQNKMLKIDERDYFALLLAIATGDNIGPIAIKPLNESA